MFKMVPRRAVFRQVNEEMAHTFPDMGHFGARWEGFLPAGAIG